MHQLFWLRPQPGKEGQAHHFTKVEAPSIEEIIFNPKEYLKHIKEEDRWNLYYTMGFHPTGKRKTEDFISQDILIFDIDENKTKKQLVDKTRLDEYVAAVQEVLGTGGFSVLCSGNGFHFILKLSHTIKSKDDLKTHKKYFDAWVEELNKSLISRDLPGQFDKAVWDGGRIMRFPETENRKPWKKIPNRFAEVVLKNKLEPFDMTTIEVRETKPTTKPGDRDYGKIDTHYIKTACNFISYCDENSADLSEPEWHGAIGVVGWFDDDGRYAHELSNKYSSYSVEETEHKREKVLALTGPRTCKNIDTLWDGCKKCPHYGKVKNPLQLKAPNFIASEDCGFSFPIYSKDGALKGYERQYEDLRIYMERELHYKYLVDQKRFLIYMDGHYHNVSPKEIEGWAQTKFEPIVQDRFVTPNFVHQASNSNQMTNAQMGETARGLDHLINCRDFVLDCSKPNDRKIKPHSPEYLFLSKRPYNYDPHPQEPKVWNKFLQTVSKNSEGIVKAIEEMVGWAILPGPYGPQQLVWCIGDGYNGKGSVLAVMREIIGGEHVSSVKINTLHDTFAMMPFLDAQVNIHEEVEEKTAFKCFDIIKGLTGESAVNVRVKNLPPVSLINRTKMIQTANKLPLATDQTEGAKRRNHAIPFDHNFKKHPSTVIVGLKEKLSAELPGILKQCLDAYDVIRNYDKLEFTKLKEGDELFDSINHETSVVGEFILEMIEVVDDQSRGLGMSAIINEFAPFTGIEKERCREKYLRVLSKEIRDHVKKELDMRRRPRSLNRRFDTKVEKGIANIQWKDSCILLEDS